MLGEVKVSASLERSRLQTLHVVVNHRERRRALIPERKKTSAPTWARSFINLNFSYLCPQPVLVNFRFSGSKYKHDTKTTFPYLAIDQVPPHRFALAIKCVGRCARFRPQRVLVRAFMHTNTLCAHRDKTHLKQSLHPMFVPSLSRQIVKQHRGKTPKLKQREVMSHLPVWRRCSMVDIDSTITRPRPRSRHCTHARDGAECVALHSVHAEVLKEASEAFVHPKRVPVSVRHLRNDGKTAIRGSNIRRVCLSRACLGSNDCLN